MDKKGGELAVAAAEASVDRKSVAVRVKKGSKDEDVERELEIAPLQVGEAASLDFEALKLPEVGQEGR